MSFQLKSIEIISQTLNRNIDNFRRLNLELTHIYIKNSRSDFLFFIDLDVCNFSTVSGLAVSCILSLQPVDL